MNGGTESFWQAINAVLDVFDFAGIDPVTALTWLTEPCDELGSDRPVGRTQDVYGLLDAARIAAAKSGMAP